MTQKRSKKSDTQNWTVYMIESQNGHLYTGITTHLERRLKEHRSGKKGARFFQISPPKRVAFQETKPSRSEALKREAFLKSLSRAQKLKLCKDSSR